MSTSTELVESCSKEEAYTYAFVYIVYINLHARAQAHVHLCMLQMHFLDTDYELFLIQNNGLLKDGEHVTLVQSGAQPIWRQESTHHIQVRKVQG